LILHKFILQTGMAHNLNVAVQPAAADARWPTSRMDFRSNEAGRAVRWNQTRLSQPD
jgi:hypothetical protein